MIHQFRDKKKIEQRKRIIRTTIGFGAFLLICTVGLLTWSGKILHFIGRPIWKAETTVINTAGSEGYILRTKASVFKENDALKQENETLKSQMIDYDILKNENDQLKSLLGRLPEKHDFILATILSKPNQSPYDSIIVDGGSGEDIVEGLQVLGEGNIPIGQVETVYGNDSLVMLYSNPGQTTEGVLDGSNASVELVGRGGGNFEMNIPLDLPSEKGTKVVLPNATTEVIAIVDSVISTPTDPIKRVLLHSPANIQALKWVQIKKD